MPIPVGMESTMEYHSAKILILTLLRYEFQTAIYIILHCPCLNLISGAGTVPGG